MGKNYVENSLKRFLKRKVKITMGVVVSFLITGAVAFGVEITDIPKGYEDRVFNGNIEIILDENTITNDFFRAKIDGGLTDNAAYYILNGAKVKNYGKVLGGNNFRNNPTIYIKNNSEYENHGYQVSRFRVIDNSVYRNYGNIVYSAGNTSYLENNSKFFNYGYFLGNVDTIALHSNSYAINYGIIKSNNSRMISQYSSGGEFKNYGVLIGAGNDIFTFRDKVTPYNYGIAISISGVGGALKPADLVIKNSRGSSFKKSGDKYILQNSGTGIVGDTKVEYGTTYETTFDIVADFTKNNISKDNYVLNSENIKQTATINGQEITKEADNIYIDNASFKLDLGTEKEIDGKKYKVIDNKAITTIYQGGGNGVVLDNNIDGDKLSGNLNLALNDTTIIGYFEKDGTLLKVDGDLTLTGNSIINAVAARDENGDILKDAQNVVAVDVFGKLTYTEGESHIFGTIKGGEGSKIVVNGTETTNPNELTETLSSSGNIYLNGQKWTKGETGSIELTGGTVHIDDGNGTLVGYLAKEENPTTKAGENVLNTTLDGMITGKGTLNVNEIRFDLGNLEINNMEDTYKVNGNKDIVVQDALNKINVSGIFNKKTDGNGNLILSLKSAEEMGIHDPSKQKEYEELVKNFKDSEEFYNLVNTGNAEAIRKYLNVLDKVMELLGTAGVKITRDITGAFTDAVVEFDKKANKGEWLTNAKYIGSDMEYDGTKHINGYDSDIKSMIGMAEYGITEKTSLGFALGGGDTEVDLKTLNGKSTSFDGKNYYAGIYAKHSMNGFDMTGSLGYTISDLDVEKGGSADSEAVTLAGYIKKDVYVTDTVKLEPNLSFTYDYIMQDKAEMGEGMTIDSGDSHVFEAGAGLNLVKEFALEKGSLKLKTGVKYSMTNIERNKDVTGKFYNADVNLGSPDIDDKEGKAHVGFDYEHETGFGVNGKYEMMWSDSGDDSRITAGISYRF